MRLVSTVLFWLTAWPAFAGTLVFAPSSMADVMNELAAAHTARTGQEVRVSLAATSQLARQLDAGAPADVFITADKEWMDWAVEREVVAKADVRMFAGNTLVVVRAADGLDIAWPDVLADGNRFAMAEPESVPAGRYAKAALEQAGLWREARANAVYGENVRVTLRLAARREVAAAIVYESDASSEAGVRTIHRFAAGSHAPIRYFATSTPDAGEEARAFLAMLDEPNAREILSTAGFTLPPFAD